MLPREPGAEPRADEPGSPKHRNRQPNPGHGADGGVPQLLESTCGRPVLNGDSDPGPGPPSATRGIAGQIVANTSLLIAVLVYMGWAYDNALYGYFHLSPLDLDMGVVEYMLRSLSLFSPGLVILTVVIVAVSAARTWGLGRTTAARTARKRATARISTVPGLRWLIPADDAEQHHSDRPLLIGAGVAVTVIALVLIWAARYIPMSTYLVLILLGSGPLLLTWPTRAEHHGRFPYSVAIVITAVCALWATALYAQSSGTRDAQAFVRDLPSQTAVVVYSVQRLALSGPGVTVQQLEPGFLYHYEYQGFRLLITRSGTYYLVPVGWQPRLDITYVVNESDETRIELLSGVVS